MKLNYKIDTKFEKIEKVTKTWTKMQDLTNFTFLTFNFF